MKIRYASTAVQSKKSELFPLAQRKPHGSRLPHPHPLMTYTHYAPAAGADS